MDNKLGENIIDKLREENRELRKQLRNRTMTKDEMFERIKKLIGKKGFVDGLYKFNSSELESFLEYLEEKK